MEGISFNSSMDFQLMKTHNVKSANTYSKKT